MFSGLSSGCVFWSHFFWSDLISGLSNNPPPHQKCVQGYNGSQLWDTSFAAQALCDAALGPDEVVDKVLRKTHSYVEQSQVRSGVGGGRVGSLGEGACVRGRGGAILKGQGGRGLRGAALGPNEVVKEVLRKTHSYVEQSQVL
jgi:hypothetical protein